ncbi:MAG: Rrf2 family transcriptional regulator [candidate division KSB1 bacterium]|nr:Rrf2 family transcriptional regulator [candidate division KSB1 bacterium]
MYTLVTISLNNMKLTTRGNYGVRAAYELAKNYGKGPVTVKSISDNQYISIRYLEQLMVRLRRSGLVQSVRGPGGGYVLSEDPARISVGEIIRILEGPITLSSCTEGATGHNCKRGNGCVSQMLWLKLGEKIEEVLNNISLYDLCQMMEQKQEVY